jgi:hypothetical protein
MGQVAPSQRRRKFCATGFKKPGSFKVTRQPG